ncbi:hypothetical protein BHM03_00038527 [Ensete ventricosum]|nr:hypothetical protein BHM03_00038527 [Ensete ventricosum]
MVSLARPDVAAPVELRPQVGLVAVEGKMGRDTKLTLSRWDVAAAAGVVASFGMGLLAVCLSMPASDYSFLKLPRTLEDIQYLR